MPDAIMPDTAETTTSAFFYGTLMSPAILARVTGRPDLSARPAALPAHRRHRVRLADYPAIVPAEPASTVRGTLVAGLTPADVRRLDVFEGDEYERLPVTVRLLPAAGGGAGAGALPPPAAPADKSEGDTEALVACETYVWRASREDLEDEEWDFDEFVRERLWRWAPGAEGERSGEYDDVDAHAAKGEDPTRGRAVGGPFEHAVDERV